MRVYTVRWIFEHWRELFRAIFSAFGIIFLALESYEVLTDANIKLPFIGFLALGAVPGTGFFFLDGFYLSGFLKKEIELPNLGSDTKIRVKFGDLFAECGWKAVGVNDFFDSNVDEDLVSSKSLHGHVLRTYWKDNRDDWEKQTKASLKDKKGEKVSRSKGNRIRYPIGTTARAISGDQKFLFVALGETNITNNVASANAEMLISSVRGMLAEARAACSMDPLAIPLMGTGLARVSIKSSIILDLIITAIMEESQRGRITREITLVLPLDKEDQINLKNHIRNWVDGV